MLSHPRFWVGVNPTLTGHQPITQHESAKTIEMMRIMPIITQYFR